MTTQVEAAQDLYNQLKPTAVRAAHSYVMDRTPHHLQDEMAAIIDADIPVTDPPTVIDAPFVSQTGAGTGSTVNCTLGNWNGAPTSRTYQWKKDGVNIGTSAPSYTLLAADVGHIFLCIMTATNAIGTSGPVSSNQIVTA
jgi:hypothetical protein